ncbi:hypothetical protein [Actinomadura nitritigenes]|uniref:hypothetical protein n=1 Tax=Actinomadura nitritigenes TaxID=134602 RepID=UPI003D8BBA8D
MWRDDERLRREARKVEELVMSGGDLLPFLDVPIPINNAPPLSMVSHQGPDPIWAGFPTSGVLQILSAYNEARPALTTATAV